MKNILIWLMAMLCLASCSTKHTEPAKPMLSQEQSAFMKMWYERYGKNTLAVLDVFKGRCVNKRSLETLDDFISGRKLRVDFGAARNSIYEQEELMADTTMLQKVQWIHNTVVAHCPKEKDDFWNCFEDRYDLSGFTYFSMPLFSKDKKWCLLSVNYITREKGLSSGRDNLYQFENGSWEEVAILSYWGKQPE